MVDFIGELEDFPGFSKDFWGTVKFGMREHLLLI
jgi:hypothetical protein